MLPIIGGLEQVDDSLQELSPGALSMSTSASGSWFFLLTWCHKAANPVHAMGSPDTSLYLCFSAEEILVQSFLSLELIPIPGVPDVLQSASST